MARASARLAAFQAEQESEEDPERSEKRLAGLRGREQGLQTIRSLVEGLPAPLPKEHAPAALLDAASAFLAENARCVSRFDAYARRLLLDLVGEMMRVHKQ